MQFKCVTAYEYFDEQEKYILFKKTKDAENQEFSILTIKYNLPIPENPSNFEIEVYYLSKFGLNENDIYEIHDKKKVVVKNTENTRVCHQLGGLTLVANNAYVIK